MRFLKQIETLFRAGTAGSLSDAQLLDRFLEHPREDAQAAFTALVDRHGAMVLRICRQILRDEQDAEDAAQATFLVLARRVARSAGASRSPAGCTASHFALLPRPGLRPHVGARTSAEGEKCEPRAMLLLGNSNPSKTKTIGRNSTLSSNSWPNPSAIPSSSVISTASVRSRQPHN